MSRKLYDNTEILEEVLELLNNKAAGGGGTDTSDATATSADILLDKTAYVNGEKITGSIPLQSAKTITPSASEQVAISSGYYASGDVKVQGDANLTAENIKKGATIFGVEGNYEGGGENKLVAVVDGTITDITAEDLAGATRIHDYAFAQCLNLMSVEIPNGVTSIGMYVFYNCRSITSIKIPDSVTSIDRYAFEGCNNLASVYYTGDIKSWCNIAFSYETANPMNRKANLYFDNELVEEVIIPNSVTAILNYSFYRCVSLKRVVIPNSVTSIGNSVFSGSGLTSIEISNGVTTIGSAVFYECINLTSVVIPDSVTSIGKSTFYSCKGLTNVVIGTGLTTIEESLFSYCESLTSVTIPDNVTSISAYGFSSCANLNSVTILGSVTSIGSQSFRNCKMLKRVDLSNNTSIPTLSNYKVFDYTHADLQIKVPANLYDEWKSATNWSNYASKIVTEFTNEL